MKTYPITEKTTISRTAKRGTYDSATIFEILDEGLFCQIAYVQDDSPMMIPTGYCRIGDKLYIHGSVGSHFLRALSDGRTVCLSVSLIDGLVLARSAFHHSVNYRSVVIFAKPTIVTDEDERWEVVKQITEHIIPARWEEIRKPNKSEMQKTMILSFPIEEASAKIRIGDPSDDEEDYNLSVWAGILPLKIQPQMPITDPKMKHNTSIPSYVSTYKRGK